MLLRVQVMLFMLFTIGMGALTSVIFFNHSCNYSGVMSLMIYGPPAITGVIA